MKYDLIIFDCDGVLVDSERLVNRITAAFFSERGLPIEADALRAMFKGKTMADLARWAETAAQPPLSDDWFYELGIATAQGFQRDLREVEGVRAVLEGLREHGTKICVASQSPPARLMLSLAVTGLDAFFGGHAYSAAQVGRPKPAPDLFLHAARRMGAAPERSAVIEDSRSGVLAARAAGMTVYGYAADEEPETLVAAGAIVFESMAQLPHLLCAG
ncbi:HAD family hydrolase [Methylococcus geothermalis]|uniref:HAD-IA family hydrolase n=1 Tax=Methylococcus geothermalis TaxID=2681310 RepID=A0A858Q857_9GAMM|nr:HAD family hydrolase [Methylococcus geothermalis]QJD30003.1 HAD-IA family hydrolase [Methylococcus geothermalis]